MRLFLDTNVLLDVLGRRAPYVADSAAVWSRVENGTHEGFISAISFNNVFYIVRRAAGAKAAREAMKLLRDAFRIVAVDEQTIHRAIDADIADFEDALQYFSALRARGDCLITRNVRGFPRDGIPAMTPDEFLETDSD